MTRDKISKNNPLKNAIQEAFFILSFPVSLYNIANATNKTTKNNPISIIMLL